MRGNNSGRLKLDMLTSRSKKTGIKVITAWQVGETGNFTIPDTGQDTDREPLRQDVGLEDDGIDYRIENNPRYFQRIEQARSSIKAGKIFKLESTRQSPKGRLSFDQQPMLSLFQPR